MTGSDAIRAVLGSRHDPHRQTRAARAEPLLLHSLSTHREVLEVVFQTRRPATVVEIGVESGQVSATYLEMGAEDVYCVDPAPDQGVREVFDTEPGLHLLEQPSPAALPAIPPADLYVLDGDHNYAVARAELDWILAHAPDAVVVLHDVLWPWARRDLYYEPTRLPNHAVHCRSHDGPSVWHDGLSAAGFVGLGAFTASTVAGGERNGVLTAIEDALSVAAEPWRLHIVPAVFGLGIVVRDSSRVADELTQALTPWTTSRLLLSMENNRIALYTRVLELQQEAASAAERTDALAETVARQAFEILRLQDEVARA